MMLQINTITSILKVSIYSITARKTDWIWLIEIVHTSFNCMWLDYTTSAFIEFGSVLSSRPSAGEEEFYLPSCWCRTIWTMTSILCLIWKLKTKYLNHDRHSLSYMKIKRKNSEPWQAFMILCLIWILKTKNLHIYYILVFHIAYTYISPSQK
jgi:hypothetical protein